MKTDRQVLQNASVVAVAPTPTVIMQPFQVRPSNAYGRSSTTTYLTLFRINQDVAQTLNEQIEVSANQAGPYKALPNNDLQNLAPGATALTTVETKGYDWVRTTGTASGAGLNVSATSVAYTDDP